MKKYKKITALILVTVMITSVFAFGSVTVSASTTPIPEVEVGGGENPAYTATYDAEWEDIIIDGDDVPTGDLFYALKFNAAKPESASWFPIYGETLDIAKYIPTKSGKTYVIGFILLADLQAGKFENAKALTIPARVVSPLKTKNKYDPKTGLSLDVGAEVKFDLGSWIDKEVVDELSELSGENGETINWFTTAENFPFGAKGEIRMKADFDNHKAASSSLKFKIPAQPKAPKVTFDKIGEETVKVDGADKTVDIMGLKGAKSTMEISTSKNFLENEVIDGTDKMKAADLKASKLFTGGTASGVIGENNKATIYIRLKATDKKPYSIVTVVEVDFSSVSSSQS